MKRLPQFDTFAIDVTKVYVDGDFNCRGYFTLESVADLAESIKELGDYPNGLQIPVVVQPYTEKEGFDFRLLAGYRRYSACTRFLNWKHIPGQVRTDLTEEQARLLNFTENLERNDLNILEEARAIVNLGDSVRSIAERISRPVKWVHARLLLLRLPEEVQQMAAAGWLNQANIRTLSQLTSPDDQIEGARRITATRQSSKNRSLTHLPRKYRDRFQQRKTKEQINKLVARMLGVGVEGGMPRVALWCAGKITDEQLDEDIQERLREQERLQDPADA